MNFDKPNEMQKSWREHVRLRGSALSGRMPCEIHHPIGRTAKAKIDGVSENIGHWYLLPLTHDEHKLVDMGLMGLEELKDIWLVNHLTGGWQAVDGMSLHEFEKFLFLDMCHNITELPFKDELLGAIERWRR